MTEKTSRRGVAFGGSAEAHSDELRAAAGVALLDGAVNSRGGSVVRSILLAIAVAIAACGSDKDASFARTVAALDDPSTRADALRDVARYWRDLYFPEYEAGALARHAQYGSGPRELDSQQLVLRTKLLRIVASNDLELSSLAAHLLYVMRPPGHDLRLLECATGRTTPAQPCLDALMVVADPRSLDAMVPLVGTVHNGPLLAMSFHRLGRRGIPYLERVLDTGNDRACRFALYSLIALVRPDDDPLFPKNLLNDDELPRLATRAMRAALDHEDPACRRRSAIAIAKHDPAAVPVVLPPLLTDTSDDVRTTVAQIIAGTFRTTTEIGWYR